MPERWTILVPVFLLAQALVVDRFAGREYLPPPPSLSRLSAEFGPWKLLRDDVLDLEVVRELRADRLLSRTYQDQNTGGRANLLVAWFQSQRAGATQPHSPRVCLPAAGWTPVSHAEVTVGTGSDATTAADSVVTNGRERAVVLYWYQTPRRVIAGEWALKFWLVADALRDHRSDTSLVRVIVWSTPGQDRLATASAVRFAQDVYPLLHAQLPLISQ